MAGDDDTLRRQIADIGLRYLKRTQGEMPLLKDLLEQAHGGSMSALEELERLAHKIHGSGAMFGFESVSQCAEVLERLIETRAVTESGFYERARAAILALEEQVDVEVEGRSDS